MLQAALCLAKDHDVSIFWDEETESLKERAKSKFGIILDSINFRKNIFSHETRFLSRLKESSKYDYIIYLSDGSLPFIACKLIVHFQTPTPWVKNLSLKTKIKTKRIHKIICNSEFTKTNIESIFHKKAVVLYPPINIENINASQKKEKIILNVGRFGITNAGSSFKKQEILVEAFKKLFDSGAKDWRLVLFVSITKNEEDKIESLKKEVGSYPVTIKINSTNEELIGFYSKTSIYWHAAGYGEDLKSNPDRAEHFGMATVEAMGYGAVPIVINAGGQKEIVQNQENGILWDTFDELVDKTLEIISDDKKRKALADKAVLRCLDFSHEVFCKNLHKILT